MTPPSGDRITTPELTAFVEQFGHELEASAKAEAQRGNRPDSRPRVGRLAGAGLAAVATLAAVALLVVPSGQIDVVAEAQAALGQHGQLLHYRSISCVGPFQGQRDEGAADCGSRGHTTEVWQTTSGRPRWRMVTPPIEMGGDVMTTSDGQRILGPQIFGRDGTTATTYWPDINRLEITTDLPADAPNYPPVLDGPGDDADVIATLRTKLGSGTLRVADRTSERGRDVVLLTGTTRSVSGDGKPPSGTISTSTLRYLVDADTFAPVRLTTRTITRYFKGNGRPKDGSFSSSRTTVFPLFERLPLTATTERLLTIVPERPPTKTIRRSAPQRDGEERARMRRENAEGQANARRKQSER